MKNSNKNTIYQQSANILSNVDTIKQIDDKKLEDTNGNEGHRERVRVKFLKATDTSIFQSYELIELLLFYCNKRSDVKPLAKQIDKHFGSSIHKILNATEEDFTKNFKGLGSSFVCLLKLIKEFQSRNMFEEIQDGLPLHNLQGLVDYLRVFYNQQQKEIFKAIFLNAKSKIIADKIISTGTINQSAVYPREIVKDCLSYNAAYVIISHNHPSGDPQPSKEDFYITLEIQKALKTIDIILFDSLIITKNSHYSFKQDGHL